MVRQEEKPASRTRQSCIIRRHDDFKDGHLLHTMITRCGGRRHARDLFKNTQQDNLEGGGAVAVGEQPKEALEIPTTLCNEDAHKLRAVGSCF